MENKDLNKYIYSEKNKTGIKRLILDDQILNDPNRGHWDIWEEYKENNEQDLVELRDNENNIIAYGRKPRAIKGAAVYIDFGTKSTTVYLTYNGNEESIVLGERDDAKKYENPTVLQMVDYETFENLYKKRDRRPDTNITDLKFSVEAYNNMMNTADDNYEPLSYFNKLKQWSMQSKNNNKYYLRDNKGKVIEVSDFENKNENNFDPIEIYAYLLGTIINNMKDSIDGSGIKDGRIIKEYYISYPTSLKKEIRYKIIDSFKKGLLKSIPNLYEKEDMTKDIKVKPSYPEPVAYVATALDQLNLIYKNKEKEEDIDDVFYSVFDFGGGTSDYCYGIFTENKGYELINLFLYGDKYLGGENILLRLAYEIISDEINSKKLIEKGIKFAKHKINKRIIFKQELDELYGNKLEDEVNINKLTNDLRYIMENILEMHNGEIERIETLNQVFLKNNDKTNKEIEPIELNINLEKVLKVMSEEMNIGIENFINGILIAFNNIEKVNFSDEEIELKNKITKKNIDNKEKYIILGGNASKSKLFQYLLNEKLEEYSEKYNFLKEFKTINPLDIDDVSLQNYYKKDIRKNKDEFNIPNMKTGVSYGSILIESNKFKIVKTRTKYNDFRKKIDKTPEIPFLYNIVYNSLNKEIDKKSSKLNFEYEIKNDFRENEWIKYLEFSEDDVKSKIQIHYTSMQYSDKPLKKENVEVYIHEEYLDDDIQEEFEDEKMNVFIRIIDPETIEYRILHEDEAPNKNEEKNEEFIIRLGVSN